jgi:hypothetical protein
LGLGIPLRVGSRVGGAAGVLRRNTGPGFFLLQAGVVLAHERAKVGVVELLAIEGIVEGALGMFVRHGTTSLWEAGWDR